MAVAALALIVIIGLALDSASWYLQASKLQRAADSAALAGSNQLPDLAAAQNKLVASLAANGIVNGASYDVVPSVSASRISVTVKKRQANTVFLRSIIPSIQITRASYSERGFSEPRLGSPYNVLGTGDLDIPGVPKQNFWLAINGPCSPMEDGDYFTAAWDRNKGPFNTSSFEAGAPLEYSGNGGLAKTNCVNGYQSQASPPLGGAKLNPEYDKAVKSGTSPSYSYYIDIPKPPAEYATTGTVDIRLFDPGYMEYPPKNFAKDDPANIDPGDTKNGSSLDFLYRLYDTKGDNDVSNDVVVWAEGYLDWDDRGKAVAKGKSLGDWHTFITLSNALVKNGGVFRMQVSAPTMHDETTPAIVALNPSVLHGANTFSIGAFPNWITNGQSGCSSIDNQYCPRVYARGAESVLVNIAADPSKETDVAMHFAHVDASSAGSTAKIFLWDPGESVNKIQFFGPDDKPIKGFSYTVYDWYANSRSAPVIADEINTSGGGGTISTNLSNQYKYNDKRLDISLPIPVSVGNGWIKIVYTVKGNRSDRTTWGVELNGGLTTPSHLVDK